MTELFVGCEAYQFEQISGGPMINRTDFASSFRNADATRAAVYGSSTLQVKTKDFTPTTDLWVHSTYSESNFNSNFCYINRLRDAGGQMYADFLWDNTALTARVWDGTATVTQSLNGIQQSQPTEYDIDYDWTNGEVRFFVDNSLVWTYAGTLPGAAPLINNVYWRGEFGMGVTEVRVSTSPTVGTRVETEAPSANGTDNTDGTGGEAEIDEITASDADALILDTAGQKRSFTSPARTVGGTGLIPKGFAVTMRMKRDVTGPQDARFYLLINSTRYFSPALGLSDVYDEYTYIWETNPDTAAPWTLAEAQDAALEWGVEALA